MHPSLVYNQPQTLSHYKVTLLGSSSDRTYIEIRDTEILESNINDFIPVLALLTTELTFDTCPEHLLPILNSLDLPYSDYETIESYHLESMIYYTGSGNYYRCVVDPNYVRDNYPEHLL